MAESRTIGVGVIGLGRIGRLHARNLALEIPRARLVAVAEPDERLAREVAAQFHLGAVHPHPQPLLDSPDVQAVVICTPTDTHAQLIEQAAMAGKQIFCEKPIALSLEAIDPALEAVHAANVRLQIGFNRRFDPSFSHLRQRVLAGDVGRPLQVRITSRDPELPSMAYLKASGGLFLDMMIHDFDMARFLLDAEPREIYSVGSARIDPRVTEEAGDIDTATAMALFATGATVTIENCRRAAFGYDQRVEVFGTDGALAAANVVSHQVTHSDAQGIHTAKPLNFFMQRYAESYALEMKHFIDCLAERAEPSVGGRDGRMAVVMGLAAQRSLEQHRPVPLNEIAAV